MASPAVSVIMNCRNGEKTLEAALKSVACQTFSDWEIVFWDNASTDSSAAIAQAFGPKLRYFHACAATSLGRARNLAIAEAKGDYIAFLDCDDLWKPEKLARQMELFANNPRLGLTCSDTEISDGHKIIGRLFKKGKPERGMVFGELLRRQWISMSSAMVSAKALKGLDPNGQYFDESLNLCEEADVFYRIAHDWQLDHIDAPLTVWQAHGGNSTFRNFASFARETRHILAKHRALYPDYDEKHGDLALLLERRADFQEAVALWAQGNGGAARKLIKSQLPGSRKAALFWLASFLPGSFFNILAKLYFAMK